MVYYRTVEKETGHIVEVPKDKYIENYRKGKYSRPLGVFEKRETAVKDSAVEKPPVARRRKK